MKTLANRVSSKDGFILATALVFLVVLSLTIFFSAGLTRTDIQVVNNLQNEKKALAIAEAGIQEALYRLSLDGSGAVTDTINGVNGGQPFIPSIAPSVPGRVVSCTPPTASCPAGASPYGIDFANIFSTTQILLTTAPPAIGTNNTTPTLQPIASQMAYSKDTADLGTIDFATTERLTVGWDLCGAADPLTGCAGGANSIRQLPLSDPRPVVKIVSVGESGAARRRVTVRAVDVGFGKDPSIVLLDPGCGSGLSLNGTTSLSATGTVQVNAGASDTSNPLCTTASTVGRAAVSSAGTSVSGSADGNFTPTAQSGAIPTVDPYAGMLPPCFGLNVTNCQSLASAPIVQNKDTNAALATCSGISSAPQPCTIVGGTLNPGIYYGGLSLSGNVTLNPGVYIIAGGGITMSSGASGVTNTGTGGVMIYNTQNDDPSYRSGLGAPGSFSLGTGNSTINLSGTDWSISGSASGPFEKVLLFQDTANKKTVDLVGGNSGSYSWDGLIYAPTAAGDLSGHTNETINGSIVVAGPLGLIGGSNIRLGTPSGAGKGGGVKYTPLAWQDF